MRRPVTRTATRAPVRVAALALTVAFGVAAVPGGASAQELRADLIAAEQAAKAARLVAPPPTTAERVVERIRNTFFQVPDGLYPYIGSVYGGGGFTLGAGYVRYYGDRSAIDVHGLYSVKQYKLIEVATSSPRHLGDRLDLSARAGWRDATQVGYWGLGIDTDNDARANFRFKEAYLGASATLRPARWAVLGGGIGYENYQLEQGLGARPSIDTRFTPDTAPGLGASPAFVHTELTGAIDWRTSPGYSRRGGYYGVALHDFSDPDDVYSFSRVDTELVQHIPVLKETWVLSLRGRMQTTLDDADVVPYFLMPALGGGRSLRAYRTARFRDRHTLLASAEWRWFPNRTAFDMAFFFDAGTVSDRRADLWSTRMKTDWGIGGRFHGPVATPLRIELAHGSEGWHIVFAGTPSF
jgi:outer membrane protein assembly factor BamA